MGARLFRTPIVSSSAVGSDHYFRRRGARLFWAHKASSRLFSRATIPRYSSRISSETGASAFPRSKGNKSHLLWVVTRERRVPQNSKMPADVAGVKNKAKRHRPSSCSTLACALPSRSTSATSAQEKPTRFPLICRRTHSHAPRFHEKFER